MVAFYIESAAFGTFAPCRTQLASSPYFLFRLQMERERERESLLTLFWLCLPDYFVAVLYDESDRDDEDDDGGHSAHV